MEQPLAAFSFTRNRISIFGTLVYGLSKWNTPYENEIDVTNINHFYGIGTEKYRYHGHSGNMGVNYRVSDNHEISLELDHQKDNPCTHVNLNPMNNEQSIKNKTRNSAYANTLFYKGQFGDNIHIYSELTYSYTKNNFSNRLNYTNELTDNTVNINESKCDVKYLLESEITTSKLSLIKIGYQLGWKKYKSEQEFKYFNTRNKLWVYLNVNPSIVLSFEFGGLAELEDINQANKFTKYYFHFLPSFDFTYSLNNNIFLKLSGRSDCNYPTLSMLNPAQLNLYHNVYQKGNPFLRSGISNQIVFGSHFFNILSVNLLYKWDNNHVIPIVSNESNNIIFEYKNCKLNEFSIPINFEYPIAKYFTFSFDGAYYLSYGKYMDIKKRFDGWWYGANFTFSKNNYFLELDYSRNVVKENLLQGFKQTGIDRWALTANKQWMQGRLSTNISWFLPFDLGISNMLKTNIKTDSYIERSLSSFKPFRNAIVINLVYRLNRGDNKSSEKRSAIELEERVTGGFNF